ncbi:hypothetical protein [Catelliglobosispora koreensis]|uniref:hypothetical protein n=1 Tax=Catelliglobosispora koreensis TaxID=129052 RepID=UPI00036D68F8|nr:hypothetical protein [Catelliglobosispora koreensis]
MKFTKLTVLTALFASAVALSACGAKPNDGIATAGNGNGDTKTSDVSSDPQERMRQFAQCMREQGIDMPDPEFGENGEVTMRAGVATEADPNDPNAKMNAKEDMAKFEAAHKACQKYQPEGGPMGGKLDPEMEAKMREFSKCMRENGVENFPDPQEGGGIIVRGGPGAEGGIDPEDPAFKAAQEKCGSILPKMQGGGPATTSKSGEGS